MYNEKSFVKSGDSKTLAVFLHGLLGSGLSVAGPIEALKELPQGKHADVFAPDLPFQWHSRVAPSQVIADLVTAIDAIWAAQLATGRPYESVLLVGHSAGSLYARKLYLVGMGECLQTPFEAEMVQALTKNGCTAPTAPRPWALAVKRLVSLAGMNGGWSISHHMSARSGLQMGLALMASRFMQTYGIRPLVVMSVRKGAPFVTQLRLQWLALRTRAAKDGFSLAPVVQLLGTEDDLVPPSGNIDPVTGSDFTYFEVPKSGHGSVLHMGAEFGQDGLERKKVFQHALQPQTVLDMAPLPVVQPQEEDLTVTDVVFVIHGIRDLGYWTQKIGLRVAALAARSDTPRKIALETSTYGYFPILSFLQPWSRQEKVEWLMDRYTAAKARYPSARFSFVGHSHGTYLLGQSMKCYPAVTFENVVLAGSVLRTDHDWQTLFNTGRVKRVLNLVANGDWVVATFPNAMRRIDWQDMGGAGHYGFTEPTQGLIQLQEPQKYVIGGHSTALSEGWWSSIAEFILHGTFEAPDMPLSTKHKRWVAMLAKWGPLLILFGILLLGSGLGLLLLSGLGETGKTLAVLAYLAVVFTILTKF